MSTQCYLPVASQSAALKIIAHAPLRGLCSFIQERWDPSSSDSQPFWAACKPSSQLHHHLPEAKNPGPTTRILFAFIRSFYGIHTAGILEDSNIFYTVAIACCPFPFAFDILSTSHPKMTVPTTTLRPQ